MFELNNILICPPMSVLNQKLLLSTVVIINIWMIFIRLMYLKFVCSRRSWWLHSKAFSCDVCLVICDVIVGLWQPLEQFIVFEKSNFKVVIVQVFRFDFVLCISTLLFWIAIIEQVTWEFFLIIHKWSCAQYKNNYTSICQYISF
jgi:hypothetical protein